MKKMTKGAIVTGLGVALLMGGGGTLAVWNAEQVSTAGVVAAGNLDLGAGKGTWTNDANQTIDVATYKVVPGETLTYTQPVTPTLEGDRVAATLEVTGDQDILAHNSKDITVSKPVLTGDSGQVLPTTVLTEAHSGTPVTASTTFTFSQDATGDQNAKWDFSSIGYYLEQQAPTAG